MIYELSRDIDDLLAAKKFPYRVTYTDRHQQRASGPHIEFRRDKKPNADSVDAPIGSNRNPRKHAVRRLGVEVRIHAESTAKGAHDGDHERECELVVDALVVALDYWTTVAKSAVQYVESRYLDAKELEESERGHGVVYLLRFTIARGVLDRDYTGAAQPTGTIGGVGSVTHVRYEGQPESDPAIGCGGDP